MSFSDTDTFVEYTGNDSDDTFAITFYYRAGQTNDLAIKAYLVSDDSETTVPSGSWDESNYPDTEYVFDSPLPSTIKVVLYRQTSVGQPTVLSGSVYNSSKGSIEVALDRIAQQVQENRAALTSAELMEYFATDTGFYTQSVADCEAAQAAAEAAQGAAEAAQGAAEAAQTGAESAQTAAESAQTAAESAQTAAETAQTGAETAETNASNSASAAVSLALSAFMAQSNAEAARDLSLLYSNRQVYTNVMFVEATDSPVTVANDTLYIADTTAGNIVFNMPASSGLSAGWKFGVLKYEDDTNDIVITPNVSDTINGSTGNLTSTYIGVGVNVYFDSGINFILGHFSTGREPAPAELGGGGHRIISEQSIDAAGQITLNPEALQQVLKVKGLGAAQTTDTDVFFGTPVHGFQVTLVGTSDTEPLTVPYSNVDGGCLVNGDCTLRENHTLVLYYDGILNRYFELGRRN